MANKRFDVINGFGERVYCVLSGEESFEAQLMRLFDFKPGMGYKVELTEKEIIIKDYFHVETVGSFDVVSIIDTDEEVNLNWNKI